MSIGKRILIAAVIVVLDMLVIVIPLTALVLAYLLLARPSWLKEWVDKLYSDPESE